MANLQKLEFYRDLDNYLKEMCFSSELSDVAIEIGNERIYAHKIILARNNVFKGMFTSNMLESNSSIIKIVDCEVNTFRTFLKYLYIGEIADNEKTLDLLVLADKYLETKLMQLCEPELCKDINVENSINKLLIGIKYRFEILQNISSTFILKHYEEVEKSQSFKSMIFGSESDIVGFFHCIVKKSRQPEEEFHLFSFDEIESWINTRIDKSSTFFMGKNKWSLKIYGSVFQPNVRVGFSNLSESPKTVDILLILISHNAMNDCILLEISDIKFFGNDEKLYELPLLFETFKSVEYRAAFYKDDVLRVKIKITETKK